MKGFQTKKLSTAILFPILFAVFFILMLLTIYDAIYDREQMIKGLYQDADYLLDISASAAEDAFWSYNDVSLTVIGDSLANYQQVAKINLSDDKQNVVYEKVKDGKEYAAEEWYPEFIREVYKNDIKVGEIHLVLTTYYMKNEIREVILQGLLRTAGVSFLILFLILFLSRNITISIDSVAQGVKAFTQGKRDGRIPVRNNHEIGRLATRINKMFDTIVDADNKLKESYLELQNKEEALRISEERYRYAADGSNDAVWDWNILTGEYYISPRGAAMIGLLENEPIDLNIWKTFIHPQDQEQFDYFLEGFRKDPDAYRQIQFRMIGSKGDIHWLFCRGKGIFDHKKQLIRVSGFYTDITERIKAEEAINHLAYFDVLTGLPNRAMLFERISKTYIEQKCSGGMGALIFMDLDDFKTINDTKGHSFGDQVLVNIAAELESKIQCEAIARIGGDEFVIVKNDCDIDSISTLAENIVKLVHFPRKIKGYEFTLSCSIGIALFPGDGTEIETLLMKADSAMYHAKLQGKDRYVFFEQSVNDQMVRKIELRKELRQGILNKEFVLHYQPQVDIVTGAVVGVEALVRWQHPVQGLLSPFHFIELAEETGLILPLGEYILRTACLQSVSWERAGFNVMMSVNVSARQIMDKNIVQTILNILEEVQMKPEKLILEITESVAMENLEHTLEVINSLKQRGITFSLDDFGTGYSSLNYLKNLPINYLKIDKQFVQSLQKQNFEEVVVRAIIKIAHSTNLIVVAEGIETKEQSEGLLGYQCDIGQGFYYGKPLPAGEIERLLSGILPIKEA